MKNKIFRVIMKLIGWNVSDSTRDIDKCILVMAPHTSSLDFIIGWICYTSVGGRPTVMIKKEFFFFPIKGLLRNMGAIPVNRDKGANVISQAIEAFKNSERMHLVITPEGTRNKTKRWKSGYHKIATEANVAVVLGVMDFGSRTFSMNHIHKPEADPKEDIKIVKSWYADQTFRAKYPEKFSTEL